MNFTGLIQDAVAAIAKDVYEADIAASSIPVTVTKREFEGDFTVVVFPLTKFARKKPQELATELGDLLIERVPELESYNVIQGFLNLVVRNEAWTKFVLTTAAEADFGRKPRNGQRIALEYSSPNTNKPLHLGHIRNIVLGWSCGRILDNAGYEVIMHKVVNDRGIAICKSMLAWHKFSEGQTPETSGEKPDHFVGRYYVMFEEKFRAEYKAWQQSAEAADYLAAHNKDGVDADEFWKGYKEKYFNEYSALGREARDMLLAWEAGDDDVLGLWRTMNGWVYQGFDTTYDTLGVKFAKKYYESETYLLGKDIIEDGLKRGVFYQKPDTSVWIDLTAAKLDHKLVLRSDGTSVYITQDLGLARRKYEHFNALHSIYVVADEQDYHFKVLFNTLKALGEPYADGLYHLSYGMVELTSGKMKSREGTVVDADDLAAEVIALARQASDESGGISDHDEAFKAEVARRVGLGALKFFILKVHPKKRMVFDPTASLDLQGHTGAYIQYAFARIQNVIRKAGTDALPLGSYTDLDPTERELCSLLHEFPRHLDEAAAQYDPSVVANYAYELARFFNKFYQQVRVLNAETDAAKAFRLRLINTVAQVLQRSMDLLGIEMPEKM